MQKGICLFGSFMWAEVYSLKVLTVLHTQIIISLCFLDKLMLQSEILSETAKAIPAKVLRTMIETATAPQAIAIANLAIGVFFFAIRSWSTPKQQQRKKANEQRSSVCEILYSSKTSKNSLTITQSSTLPTTST